MSPYPNSVLSLSRKPSAFVPMAMSLTALAVVLGNIAVFGVVREADEGAAAAIGVLRDQVAPAGAPANPIRIGPANRSGTRGLGPRLFSQALVLLSRWNCRRREFADH